MKWLEARHLDSWAESTGARERLSEIVAQLVRASAASISEFDFPTGDSAQTTGYDGRLTAIPAEAFRDFLPEGNSVWEWGTGEDCLEKANKDYRKRTENPGPLVDQPHTTFVFVSARRWDSRKPTRAEWEAEKTAEKIWLGVKALDAGSLEAWFEKCPAVAGTVAREILRTLPVTGALSADEYWEEYSTQFKPRLREEALLAGREEQAKEMLQALNSGSHIHQWQGDSLAEVLAFMIACVRTSEDKVRKFLESRLLLLESKDAVRHLADSPNLIFAVRGEAAETAGMLRDNHAVIFPLGRDSLRDSSAIRLNRPSTFEMAEALRKMDLGEADSQRLALECDRSVTILAHRIPSAIPRRPSWYNDSILVPAFLAGSWDAASKADCAIVARLAGVEKYSSYETQIRQYRQRVDAPLESEGTVWAIRAPVDVFVNIEQLLGAEHFIDLEEVTREVFGQVDPAMDLAIEKRPFAKLYDATLPHSGWIREGLANTLLVVAALGGRGGLTIEGRAPQHFVNRTIASIPALRDNHRVLTSLSHELPLLMEAAPGPLLYALEQLLEGDGHKLLPIFQDKEANSFLFTRSPHTGFLWALEMIAWDPAYLPRASSILLRLSKIDPGGSLGNRPSKSLLHIFLPWLPATNAPLVQRIGGLDQLLDEDEATAWKLLVELLPGKNDIGSAGPKLRYRESGASEREVMTHALLSRTYHEVIRRAWHALASRWRDGNPSYKPCILFRPKSSSQQSSALKLIWGR